MKVALDTEGTLAGFKKTLDRVAQDEKVKGLLALSCIGNNFTPREFDPLLAEMPLPVFGACFPGIMFQDHVFEQGTLAIGLPVIPKVQLIEELSRKRENFDDAIDTSLFDDIYSGTMVVLVDGMSLRVNSLLESIFSVIGLNVGYIGGGASSLDFIQKPCLFTNAGLKQDCAVLAHVPLHCGIGIAHGMTSVGGPHKVTGASFNTITTVDWQPAAQFYKDTLSRHPDYDTGMPGLIGTDAHYSLGLTRYDAERIILEPIQEGHDGSLVFMKEIREGEFVDIMHITASDMIQSASSALNRALDAFGSTSGPQTVISFDCISRKLFLGNRYGEELTSIFATGTTHIGALTAGGEIGTSGKDFLDYHNRTCVVGVFEE